mmetsp:Transcript_27682/g.58492  ORF Transcript_27682/g.58492 Transcript_27682/m.58492 type:complete len:89 (-) Transcript_27682:144-410(-)
MMKMDEEEGNQKQHSDYYGEEGNSYDFNISNNEKESKQTSLLTSKNRLCWFQTLVSNGFSAIWECSDNYENQRERELLFSSCNTLGTF